MAEIEIKSSARKDHLREIELAVQKEWEQLKPWEVDPDEKKPKFFVTFPYPYMNGVLHLGHAFSMSKAEFAVRYQRLQGKTAVFPFGFHCTGMPIMACADKLKLEIDKFGNPPRFPVEEEEEEVTVNKDAKKKKKAKLAKKTGKQKYQWQILADIGVPTELIPKFADPQFWLSYFPPIGLDHLKKFGVAADFRRTFVTTDANPYYDSFIHWQFNHLKKADKIGFGARHTVFSPSNGQPCLDHDRSAAGEGLGPQEYTLIKMELLQPYPEPLKSINKKIFLVAATLRPETMYGQTNCWVLPEGEYGAFEVNDDEVFVCTEHMSYQDMTPEKGSPNELASVTGQELIGCKVKAPLAQYEFVYVLPLLTIDLGKGTGVVTCVPSDAPDDYAALMDLKRKENFRKEYNIADEMVMPFEVVPIIEIPGLGTCAAAKLCEEQKVKSQKDREKLAAIKEQVYTDGFYKGIMTIGECKGEKVEVAKTKIKERMINEKTAVIYYEPEGLIISRAGDECVVALVDQWYLKYGEPEWKAQVAEHVNNKLETYNPVALKMFQETVGWLKEWACSRSYGLGTHVPWDPTYVIESLSDSTIYMAYYTIAHYLQGNMEGSVAGTLGIEPNQLTDEVFDYVFLGGALPANCAIAKEKLDVMKAEFEYWYPMDLRVSGKDLIQNHLTMALYNHCAIWPNQDMMPRSYFTNGHIMIDKKKMSKSTGNFFTVEEAVERFSADATRFGLADAGDNLNDANFDATMVNANILSLTKEEAWFEETLQQWDQLQSRNQPTFFDQVFANQMNYSIIDAENCYNKMQFHEALRAGFWEMKNARDEYRVFCVAMNAPMSRDLIGRYMEAVLIMLSPVCPHLTQHLWKRLAQVFPVDFGIMRPALIIDAAFPKPSAPVDQLLMRKMDYLREVSHSFRTAYSVHAKKVTQKNQPLPDLVHVFVATDFPDWQTFIIEEMRRGWEAKQMDGLPSPQQIDAGLKEKDLVKSKREKYTAMQFVAALKRSAEKDGAKAFELKLPFDEKQFLQGNIQFICRDTANFDVNVYLCGDESAPKLNGQLVTALPAKPTFIFDNKQ